MYNFRGIVFKIFWEYRNSNEDGVYNSVKKRGD